jgi:hypothetical protein
VDHDQTALLELIGTAIGVAAGRQVCWATDLNGWWRGDANRAVGGP